MPHRVPMSHGMPDGLAELGFRSTSDLWRPWCMARVDGDVASIAFAARISEVGAELGVATVKALRGRGLCCSSRRRLVQIADTTIPRTVLQHRCEQRFVAADRRPAGPSFSGSQLTAVIRRRVPGRRGGCSTRPHRPGRAGFPHPVPHAGGFVNWHATYTVRSANS
jgi:hypothetical protein